MRRSLYSLKSSSLFLTFFLLISCNTSINAGDDPSVYALRNSENFKNVKGYMVYSHSDTHLTYMELRLRNLYSGEEEILLSSKKTKYTTVMSSSISQNGNLIFINAHKANSDDTFMLLYDIKKRKYKELVIGHSAIAGDISPNNLQLLFYSDFNDKHNYNIYISNLDGKKLVKLNCPNSQCSHPSWSDDGKKIVFISDSRKIYEYNVETKKQKLLYALINKRKYELNYPLYYNNTLYFSKTTKNSTSFNKFNTEIIKFLKNKPTSYYKSKDTFFSVSFISDLIFLHSVSSNSSKENFTKIQIQNLSKNNVFSLTTSDIRKYQNSAPHFINSLQ